MIGIVGGVGPYAGLDLAKKIFNLTPAVKDQDHMPVCMISESHTIGDRTEFLLGETQKNPAHAVVCIIEKLKKIGATVVGIPCNTMHAPPIWDMIEKENRKRDSGVKLLHMIEETAAYLKKCHPEKQNVGILSTTGTYKTKLYPDIMQSKGFTIIHHTDDEQEIVHKAIYDETFGIKAQSEPVTQKARQNIMDIIDSLRAKGAEIIILGCTELPLTVTEERRGSTIIVDPTAILARALIKEYDNTITVYKYK